MPRYELRPSKPHAVFIAIGALAILIFGVGQMLRAGEFHWFAVLWVLIGLVVIGGTLTQAFSRRRGTAVATVEAESEHEALPWRMRLARNKPLAVIGAVLGAGVLVYAAIRMSDRQSLGSVVFFALFGLAVIGFNLWAAFSPRGATHTLNRPKNQKS
jgi:type VI protein secretion system component VasK